MSNQITVLIIAGGKSSRMGQNKALIELDGKRMIDRAIDLAMKISSRIIVSTNQDLGLLDFPQIKDEIPNLGPIGGLYTGLKMIKNEGVLVLPCDAPFLTLDILSDIVEAAKDSQVVIPKHADGKLEPLIAYYSKSVLPQVEKKIEARDYKLVNLFKELAVKYIPISDDAIFRNMNSRADLNLWNDQIS